MKNKKRFGLLHVSSFVLVIFLAGLIQCSSMAAGLKSPDLNGDRAVNMSDVMILASVFNTVSGDGKYREQYDLNGDNAINMSDVMIIASQFNTIISVTDTPQATATNTPGSTPVPSDNGDKILIPHKSWTCGMADGIPQPEKGVLVCEINMKIDQIYNLGKTQYGQRQVYVIQSGTITGSKFSGSVMSGGLDFQLELSNGAMEIEQILILKSKDGQYIHLRYAGTGASKDDIRMVPNFEAPSSGSSSWLNSGKYAGRRVIDQAAKTMKVSVYDVSNVSIRPDSTNSFTVNEPSDVPDQQWDFRRASSERNGNQFIVETVTLAGSQSVGSTKNGVNRNVIPITGGSVSGKLSGKVLFGGADYQNLSGTMIIDARYLWQTNDGEVIIVRNAGPMSQLVPTFEVRADSNYSYLNSKLYLSSGPGGGGGGVSLTFYESIK